MSMVFVVPASTEWRGAEERRGAGGAGAICHTAAVEAR